jgi:hypothetical protein
METMWMGDAAKRVGAFIFPEKQNRASLAEGSGFAAVTKKFCIISGGRGPQNHNGCKSGLLMN